MKMTLEQHREFGQAVREFREQLLLPHIRCVGTKSSREYRAVAKALKAIDHLKHSLDSVVCNDFPECKDATRIYYGASDKWIANH